MHIESSDLCQGRVKNYCTLLRTIFCFQGEVLPDKSEHVVGQEPLGFPLNVSIRAEPTVLYSVACHDYDVAFSSFFPPMCLTTAKDDCYKVKKTKRFKSLAREEN